MLRVPLRRSPSPAEMQAQLQAEVDAAYEDSAVLRVFRRFRQRQLLRIGANDVIRDRPLEEITRDISRTADVALEVALATALRHVGKRHGQPCTAAGRPVSCVVLAFGKHGGEELNYSSDIDLMFVYEEEGATRGKRTSGIGNDEFFAKVVGEVVRLLSAHTDRGLAYRIDLRLRPEGHRGPLARSLASTLSYYDTLGRTWERQALIKVRPAAGDLALGQRFLQAVEPFVYRKYLTFAEINEIKALKRRIEQKAGRAGVGATEVKTGRGGIRDIEFTIQFLQLLNGGDLPAVRQRNTLLALQALERAGCLTDQEYRVLDDSYRFLRKTEHRLQLLFDLQTHRLPDDAEELRKLALRMGYPPQADGGPEPRAAFLADYRDKTEPTRRILDHLLAPDLRRRGRRRRAGVRPHPRHQSRPGNDPIRPRPLSLPRRAGRLQQPRPAGPGVVAVSVHAPLPPLPGQHRPRPAPRRRRDARPRHGPRQPGKGDQLARRQDGALGAVQLQPAEPETLRRSVRLEPIPLRIAGQQSWHDRRAARHPRAQPAAHARRRCARS